MDLPDWPESPENWVREVSLEAEVSTVCPDPQGYREPKECLDRRETRDRQDLLEVPAWPETRDLSDPPDPSDHLDPRARKDREVNLDSLDYPERTDYLETTDTPAEPELKETRDQRDTRDRWVSPAPVE